MEIERKFLTEPAAIPFSLEDFPSSMIEQAYLCTAPVVRVRRDGDRYYLTYKSEGLLAREEYNLPLTKEAYEHLAGKADGILLKKRRYRVPDPETGLTIEIDVFSGEYRGLCLTEVEFETKDQAASFRPPEWFGREVTWSEEYQNSRLAMKAPGQ